MPVTKAHIIAQLQKEILPLQGFKPAINNAAVNTGLGSIKFSFPGATFPLGAVHEFICSAPETLSAAGGFISGILSALMHQGGASVWINSSQTIFPPSLKGFGIEPDKIVFINLKREKDRLWALEEALKCDGIAAVVAEIRELSFAESRRLQLAVEQSLVTGFIIRNNPRNLNTTACISRWKITHMSSVQTDDMPGVGFPCWNVELLKVRNGKPGRWQMEWSEGRFRHITEATETQLELQKKTG
jgi:protein ImuA